MFHINFFLYINEDGLEISFLYIRKKSIIAIKIIAVKVDEKIFIKFVLVGKLYFKYSTKAEISCYKKIYMKNTLFWN